MNAILMKSLAVTGSVILGTVLAAGASIPAVADQPDYDRYIVSFLDVAKGKAALRAAGARIELDLAKHEAAAVHIPARALKGLSNNPNIEYIEKDVLRYPMTQTTPWGIPAVQAHMVMDTAAGNRTVCIIDSGYERSHEDLSSGNNVKGYTDSRSGNWFEDDCFHGSHVAGTIAAINNTTGVVGVLPNDKINLYIVKVFDGSNCAWAYSSSLVDALDRCVAADANVVSMSLGGGIKSRTEDRAFRNAYNALGILSVAAAGNDGNTRKSYPASYNSVISVAAVDSARVVADFSQQNAQVELAGPGVAVRSSVGMDMGLEESLDVGGTGFEATGMDGSYQDTVTGPLYRCDEVDGIGSPGDCAEAREKICLISRGDITFAEKVKECEEQGGFGAVIFNNADALFSGTLGSTVTGIPSVGVSGVSGAVMGFLIDSNTTVTATVTVAPGNYAFYGGTSMATPHVAGVAALVWSQDTSCTNEEIRNALTGTAFDLGDTGRDAAYGYGLVQAFDASTAIKDSNSILFCDPGGGGGGGSSGGCDLGQKGDSCSSDTECCSGTCKGRPGKQSCK